MGGFHTEYSSVRFAMFYLAEFMNMITMSAVMVTLFFGGPDGPGFHFVRWLWPILWFAGKTLVFISVYVWVRAALPRLRYDQLMELGWKVLIPLSFGWLLVVSASRVGQPGASGSSSVSRSSPALCGRRSSSARLSPRGAGESGPHAAGTAADSSCGPVAARRRWMMAREARNYALASSVVSPSP